MTGITYRTVDLTRWGVGSGADLSATQIDLNFWTLAELIAALPTTAGRGIDYFEVNGSLLLIHMTDHSILGPYVLPVAQWIFRGEWHPGAYYVPQNVITFDGSVYLVLWPHFAGGTFDPNANDGMGHQYYGLLLSYPGQVIPGGGTLYEALLKRSNASLDMYWGFPPWAVPTGGDAGWVLEKHSSADWDTIWVPPPAAIIGLPPGGATESLLVKHSSSNYDAIWQAPADFLTYVAANFNLNAVFNPGSQCWVDVLDSNQHFFGGIVLNSASTPVADGGSGVLGNFTFNNGLGPHQCGQNNGAFTITAPAGAWADGACTILITNDASAGAITFTGFTVGSNTGDAYVTTNGFKFLLHLRTISDPVLSTQYSTYQWQALQ